MLERSSVIQTPWPRVERTISSQRKKRRKSRWPLPLRSERPKQVPSRTPEAPSALNLDIRV